MKQPIVLYLLFCFCLGCEDVQKTDNAPMQVDTAYPVAKLVKSTPATHSSVRIGETITLEFTAVPENLNISVDPMRLVLNGIPLKMQSDRDFHISSLDYNGDKHVSFVVLSRTLQKGRTYPFLVSVRWTHGHKELEFEVNLFTR